MDTAADHAAEVPTKLYHTPQSGHESPEETQ
jgi:hypothetical protein